MNEPSQYWMDSMWREYGMRRHILRAVFRFAGDDELLAGIMVDRHDEDAPLYALLDRVEKLETALDKLTTD